MKQRQWKIIEALNWASSFLKIPSQAPEILLAHLLQVDRVTLLGQLREPCPEEVLKKFQALILRHHKGIPVQYLIGEEQFYSRSFYVNESVLIPRPETEELVQLMLNKISERFQHKRTIAGCDIGTGSGCIAITMAKEEARLNMTAIDISKEALKTARKNAERHAAHQVTFLHGNLLEPAIEQKKHYDVVVSNPPYIESKEIASLDVTVREHEPVLALDGGKDGCNFYRSIISQLPYVLKAQALIGFEVGVGQSTTVANLLTDAFPHAQVDIVYDINGKDRIVTADIGF